MSQGYSLTIAQLKAIPPESRNERSCFRVLPLNRWFGFVPSSSRAGDDSTVIQPGSGTGRWEIMTITTPAQIGAAPNSEIGELSDLISNLQFGMLQKIDADEKGIANGVATLGSDGRVVASQLRGSTLNYDSTTGILTLVNARGQSFQAGLHLNSIIQITDSDPSAFPNDSQGQKLHFRGDTGEFWLSRNGSWSAKFAPVTALEKDAIANLKSLAFKDTVEDADLGDRTADDSSVPFGLSGSLTQWLGWIANRIRAITGKLNWWETPAITLEATAIHIADTNNPHQITPEQIGAATIAQGNKADSALQPGAAISDIAGLQIELDTKANQTALVQEISDRTNADTALQTALDATIAAQTTKNDSQDIAISTLQTDLGNKVDLLDSRLTDDRTPVDGSVTDIKVAANANIAWEKISKSGAIPGDIGAASETALNALDAAIDALELGKLDVSTVGTIVQAYSAILDAIAALNGTGLITRQSDGTIVLTDPSTLGGSGGGYPANGSVTDASVATNAAIDWSKISKTGAQPSDIGAATTAQGNKADTALQPGAAISDIAGLQLELDAKATDTELTAAIDTLNAAIDTKASQAALTQEVSDRTLAVQALQTTISNLGTIATQNANNVAITGGTISGITTINGFRLESPQNFSFRLGTFNQFTNGGESWTAIGRDAGRNCIGNNWIAIGAFAGLNNTTGSHWTGIGLGAGQNNVTGSNWTGIGAYAGLSNTGAGGWTAIGNSAGQNNTTGINWIAIGAFAGLNNTTGSRWTAIGEQAAFFNATGSSWTAIGRNAGRSNTGGSNWVAIGELAGSNSNTSGGVFIGFGAGQNETNNNRLHIANNSSESLINGDFTAKTLQINGQLTVASTVASTSTTTGAIVVPGAGGVGVGGAGYFGGDVFAQGVNLRTAIEARATAAQGEKADSALQPDDIGTNVQAHSAQLTEIVSGFAAATNGQILQKSGSNLIYVTPATGGGGSADWASPGAIGSTTPNSAIFTTVQAVGNIESTNTTTGDYRGRGAGFTGNVYAGGVGSFDGGVIAQGVNLGDEIYTLTGQFSALRQSFNKIWRVRARLTAMPTIAQLQALGLEDVFLEFGAASDWALETLFVNNNGNPSLVWVEDEAIPWSTGLYCLRVDGNGNRSVSRISFSITVTFGDLLYVQPSSADGAGTYWQINLDRTRPNGGIYTTPLIDPDLAAIADLAGSGYLQRTNNSWALSAGTGGSTQQVGTIATQDANNVTITGGAISGLSSLGVSGGAVFNAGITTTNNTSGAIVVSGNGGIGVGGNLIAGGELRGSSLSVSSGSFRQTIVLNGLTSNRLITIGDTAPINPAVNDEWHERDSNGRPIMEWFWDGTRWLSTETELLGLSTNAISISGASNARDIPVPVYPNSSGIWIERISFDVWVSADQTTGGGYTLSIQRAVHPATWTAIGTGFGTGGVTTQSRINSSQTVNLLLNYSEALGLRLNVARNSGTSSAAITVATGIVIRHVRG